MTRIFAAQDTQTFEELLEAMRVKLRRLIPDVEIRAKARLAFEINTLKRRLNAIILGHNYMEPALYCSVPDNVGDSLQLARFSAQSNADIIVFCGVKFMAETAKILNPDRMVLIPSLEAGCSLAEGISGDDVKALKRRFPGAPVVSYVNTHAETKAASDYCCTSGNSEAVLRYLLDKGHKHIIFVPDEFLARNTARELGVAFIEGWIPGTEKDLRADTPAVAIARTELIYPFPKTYVTELVAGYPNLEEIIWCQEEPENMGCWPSMRFRLPDAIDGVIPIRYVGRPERSSPSEGYPAAHRTEQERIVLTALTA